MKYLLFGLLSIVIFTFTACEIISPDDENVLVPLTVMEDPSIPSISIGGILLHAETFGNPTDPMLLVLHGGPGGDYRGLLNFSELAKDGFFVVFYDQRGCGLSQRLGKDAFSAVQVYIDELDGVIKHYRSDPSQKVILAGHSWGAMLATAFVNQKPNDVTGMILAEPGGFTWEQTETYIGKSRKLSLLSEATNDFVYQDQFLTGNDHAILDYKVHLSLAGDIGTGDLTTPPYWRYGGICNIASIDLAVNNPNQMDFTSNLSMFKSKVLFAYSELNPSYGVSHAEIVSSSLPNVQLVKILGCGHEIPHFGWNNFYPIIKQYLSEIL